MDKNLDFASKLKGRCQMAKAYTHMPLRERMLCFIRDRERELKEDISDAETEIAMWKQEGSCFHQLDERSSERKYLQGRIDLAATLIAERKAELVTVGSLWDILDPCKRCHGMGKLTHIISQDESESVPCHECGGTGYPKKISS